MTEIGGTMSHYKILEKLGEGGMGVVYRAEDTNLGRQVAVKVLPDIFSGDPERLARFEREARLLASLNHPNIATIYGLEQADSKRFLAMELVEGETLAQRLLKGPLPVEEALDVCSQVAEGVEAAHEKGVIHRDLKPANIKITPEGKVKILDFGLAKAFQEETSAADLSQSPTLTAAMTRAGVILGTAAYMSPEQAKGKPVDKRTDIWAFGCILYECLTGRRAFEGESVTETLAAVLRADPGWSALPVETPWRIWDLLGRCLQRDLSRRLRDIGDAGIEIMDAIKSPANELPFRPADSGDFDSSRRRQTHIIRFLLSVLALAILALSFVLWRGWDGTTPNPADRSVSRFFIETPPDKQLWGQADELTLALSMDGQRLVYIGTGDGRRLQLYSRSMKDLAITSIPATLGMQGSSLCLSPDGQWACYYKDQTLWKIRLEEGVPMPLHKSAARIYHADWGENHTIVFSAGSISGLYSISDAGGAATPLTTLDKSRREVYHSHPQILSGGKAVLFTVSFVNYDTKDLEVLLASGERKTILKNIYRAQYLSSGHLVFARGETIFAVPFDLERMSTYGQEEALVPGVQVDPMFHRVALFAVSGSGDLIYTPAGQGMGQNELVWAGRKEAIEPLPIPAGIYHSPRISADGRSLAVTGYGRSGSEQVSVCDSSRMILKPLIDSEWTDRFSIWRLPDDKQLAFGSNRNGLMNMFLMDADGMGEPIPLQDSTLIQEPWSWSPDGKLLAYVETTLAEDFDIYVLSIDQNHGKTARPFLATAKNEAFPQFSPKDGRWIAYVSDESEQTDVWIAEYDPESGGAGRKERVSRSGGWEPVWSRDGSRLFYRSLDGTKLMAVDIQTQPELTVGNPQPLIDEPDMPPPDWVAMRGSYDVARDGRFLMISGTKSRSVPIKLVIVQNWSKELNERCPTGK